ncbi:MAG: TIGR04084 family radical SAM/SPASM domain-containing protein [Candidatus Thermoplasmatota archaeon]|nr:TIGR04084 family radical SAM/SPASM domain-containing protein [Candidatus Thermoplasmatota archaeon]
MQYHVITTERCNLSCRYCGGTRNIPDLPLNISYDIGELGRFLSLDDGPVIGFYGGEPLLAVDRMVEIMDRIPARAFTLQTNGTLLKSLPDAYLKRLHSILVSIDGSREITDHNRGAGTYDRVMNNVMDMRDRGFTGDLVARMAFSDGGDILRDVTHLLDAGNEIFDHVHWQLDVFWSEIENREDITGFLDRYDDGISRLVDHFLHHLRKGGRPRIVPFIPLMSTLLTGIPSSLRCGSGIDSFSIMTSGEIHACPIAPELPYSLVGHICSSRPSDIAGSRPVGSPCTECDILDICGGRCLYSNMTMSWGRELFDRVCVSTGRMIDLLREALPEVRHLLDEGILPADSFDHPRINDGCEIIP